MRLTSFSVSNFRSITTAKKVPLTDYSVLVGANNEGKSNILHALAIGMEVIENFKYSVRRDALGRIIRTSGTVMGRRTAYDWQRDYPISKQARCSAESGTEVIFDFSLSAEEVQEFQSAVGSKLNGSLPVSVVLKRSGVEVSIPKQGPGAAALNEKKTRVADFVSRNVSFEYIPAVRTEESAEGIVRNLVMRELSMLDDNAAYLKAIDEIANLQRPILDRLSKSVSDTVSSFLPSVKSVSIALEVAAGSYASRRALEIEVDDGNKTPLSRKGDGVKSLVALALMRHASTARRAGGASIIAIEEPEAHLHPKATHEIRDILIGLSADNQVILTSHSPLFVNPGKLESTIIVRESKAGVAKNIAEVRDVLGVRLSDNLQSARLVAIVEGDDDVITMKAIIEARYPKLENCIKEGHLVFDSLGGASNLSYKVRTYRSSATLVQCFLDHDGAGERGVRKALDENIIQVSDYNLFQVSGLSEAELEDLFDPKKYREAFLEEYQVDPTIKPPAASRKKWSDAMKVRFSAHGKIWDEKTEMQVKLWLARYGKDNIDNIILESRFSPVEAFLKSLERKLDIKT